MAIRLPVASRAANRAARVRPWSIRWADPGQLDAMAAHSGLQVNQRWADYDRTPFCSTSGRHVTVYTSAGNPAWVRT